MKCASCHGSGQVLKVRFFSTADSPTDSAEVDWFECPACEGTGEVLDAVTETMPLRAQPTS